MAKTRPMVRKVSIVPATYIQVAGGWNLAALKKFSVAGSVNLPTMCGMKNSPQTRRRTTTPLVKSKSCAKPDISLPCHSPCSYVSFAAPTIAPANRRRAPVRWRLPVQLLEVAIDAPLAKRDAARRREIGLYARAFRHPVVQRDKLW